MATEVKLPELGENVTSGDLVKLLVAVGDTIQKDQPILELETEKASIEVPSPVGGKVTEIHVKEGEKIKVGTLILSVEDGAAPAKAEKPKEKPKEEKEEKEAKPEEEEKKEQKKEEKTEAKDVRKTAPPAKEKEEEEEEEEEEPGKEEAAKEKEEARKRATEDRDKYEGKEKPSEAPARPGEETRGGRVAAAPSVRRMARELGVAIEQVRGSGPAGRISAEDVTEHARGLIAGGGGRAAAGPLPDFTQWGEVERRRMTAIRRKTSEHLSAAWNIIPHVTQNDKADITELEKLRERYGKRVEAVGGKLTMTAIALKIAAAAIRRFPQFGASLDVAAEEIIYKQYVHIGVAVDTDRGLLVPVIRDVDRKSIAQLSAELGQAAERARNKKLTLEEMQGGVFTITNLGGIGGTFFAPIVNHPEVAILGLARAAREAVWVDGQFQPRLMLPLSLSYDHRLIDGADAARFLRWFAEALEQPLLALLEA